MCAHSHANTQIHTHTHTHKHTHTHRHTHTPEVRDKSIELTRQVKSEAGLGAGEAHEEDEEAGG